MSEFLQCLAAEIQRRRLLPRGGKILVAVSGGADSVVLLHVLQALAAANGWQLAIAHFNHQLRGRASDADEKLVRSLAKQLSLPFFSERADVAGFARRARVSVEMAARQLRHAFLARVARAQRISVVALAHHADDQVELFFLRLLRGAGGEGLAGMKVRAPSPADQTITLVRPLLAFSKSEILAFARAGNFRFRHDATNFTTDLLRNRIRNELLPLLQRKYQPGLAKTVLRAMEIVGAEAECVGDAAQTWERRHPAGVRLRAATRRGGSPPPLPETGFNELPRAVQRRVLQRHLAEIGVNADFDLIEQLREASGKWVSLSQGLAVARNAGGKVCCRQHAAAEFNLSEIKVSLSGRAGRVVFAGREFRWQIQPPRKFVRLRPRPGGECFDAGSIGREIILRHWRAGDRFQPIGLKSAVKLQDLFVNAKIPAGHRRRLVVATTAAGEVFWVEGLRIGEKFKLTPATNQRLHWRSRPGQVLRTGIRGAKRS